MASQNKRIGFVDYKLDNFHANVYLKHFRQDLTDRGYTVAGCIGLDKEMGKAWAEKNDVPWFETPEELNRNVDVFIVLAPSNPEVHLQLCEMVFPFGKTTYVDKTFAPDFETAKKIFALADQHNVPVQTTSALRYTSVQDYANEVGQESIKQMVTWGPGGSFEEYAIHPLELCISCMGPQVESIMRRDSDNLAQLLLNFSGGRNAVVNVYPETETPYAASISTAKGTKILEADLSTLFLDTAKELLDFFDSGKPSVDRQESLIIRRILDVAADPAAKQGFVKL